MLAVAENAAPVDAVVAVTRELGVALWARSVSFLIADLSGRALVRLAHVPLDGDGDGRREGEETATVVPFDGGPAEQATPADAATAWLSRPRQRTPHWPHTPHQAARS
jgi:hypothetical protein